MEEPHAEKLFQHEPFDAKDRHPSLLIKLEALLKRQVQLDRDVPTRVLDQHVVNPGIGLLLVRRRVVSGADARIVAASYLKTAGELVRIAEDGGKYFTARYSSSTFLALQDRRLFSNFCQRHRGYICQQVPNASRFNVIRLQ